MRSTQEYLPIKDIHDDIVILKDGSLSLVLETTAVNFGLLSENEQLAIISAFAALLNSLSFSIQIIIRSKRLDITSYLKLLSTAESLQKNPLLARLMADYRKFIETIVRENQVLDKKFYIIISVSPFEVGLTGESKDHFQKALTVLLPRRDHIIRQLWRTGLKGTQLTTKQLLILYYDVYNPAFKSNPPAKQPAADSSQIDPALANPLPPQPQPKQQPQIQPSPETVAQSVTVQQTASQQSLSVANPAQTESVQRAEQPPQRKPLSVSTPFVVEELADEYGTV